MMHIARNSIVIIHLMLLALLVGGCAHKATPQQDPPPILTQDELIRPYVRIGVIQVTREVYGSDLALTPNIREWGLRALREEAGRMGADAVIQPEITGHSVTYIVVPSTEYRATGVAIKFN
jgi:hypothetical protein